MLEILRQRRSIRQFESRSIEPEKVAQLREAILRAPTSRNLQPCQFVFVDDRQTIKALSHSKAHGTAFLQTATLAVVVTADPECSDVWIEDCAIAAIILQLAAEALGLKSCWGQLRQRPHDDTRSASDFVRELLGIPATQEVPIVIGLGYPAEEKAGHPYEALPSDKIHTNRFSD
ncbi:MAG: NAD(P)H-dependent dehydrogenase/reductase [Desulfuromonas sp.]|nr:MAG: NAD(P)H-dependent dehydrogenase/reductase [Desulfuromonas sp.]